MINDRYFAGRMHVLPLFFTPFATILRPNELLLIPPKQKFENYCASQENCSVCCSPHLTVPGGMFYFWCINRTILEISDISGTFFVSIP